MDSGVSYSLKNPLILISGILAVAGWVIAFIGGCAGALHGVGWWIIIYELLFIIGVFVSLGIGAFITHRMMTLTFLAISIVYLTGLIQLALVYSDSGGIRAVVGGSVIMIIMQFIWLVFFAASGDSWLGGFGQDLNGGFRGTNMMPNRFMSSGGGVHPEKDSPLPPPATSGMAAGATEGKSDAANSGDRDMAVALHGYEASSDDPNELSFDANEEIEILKRQGNWWEARKKDGSTGIVPSNYFQ